MRNKQNNKKTTRWPCTCSSLFATHRINFICLKCGSAWNMANVIVSVSNEKKKDKNVTCFHRTMREIIYINVFIWNRLINTEHMKPCVCFAFYLFKKYKQKEKRVLVTTNHRIRKLFNIYGAFASHSFTCSAFWRGFEWKNAKSKQTMQALLNSDQKSTCIRIQWHGNWFRTKYRFTMQFAPIDEI